MNEFKFNLPDMTCGHCAATVTKTLLALDSEAQVHIDRPARQVQVSTSAEREALVAALSEEGFPPAD
jgi:copper chaperone